MKVIEIVGDNYFGKWDKTRTACRGIIIDGNKILLSYETVTDQWMIPGGGLENGETERACCIREIAEETGCMVETSECMLEIDEYYEEWKFISLYYLCKPIGEVQKNLTDREKSVGMELRWIPINKAIEAFSKHNDYATTDEMRRGLYLREYTALSQTKDLWEKK